MADGVLELRDRVSFVSVGIIGGLGSFYLVLLIFMFLAWAFSGTGIGVIDQGGATIDDVLRNSKDIWTPFLKISLAILVSLVLYRINQSLKE